MITNNIICSLEEHKSTVRKYWIQTIDGVLPKPLVYEGCTKAAFPDTGLTFGGQSIPASSIIAIATEEEVA